MFYYGAQSRKVLDEVTPRLRVIMYAALAVSIVDVSAFEGLRTMERQRKLVAQGVSQTLRSKHLPQADGLAWAVDMVPYVRGELKWDEHACDAFAEAVHWAANEYDLDITWGGAWGRSLRDYTSAAAAKWAYYEECSRKGKTPFYDGAHFELPTGPKRV